MDKIKIEISENILIISFWLISILVESFELFSSLLIFKEYKFKSSLFGQIIFNQ